MSNFLNIDWDIVRKDCRKMGLILILSAIIIPILPLEIGTTRQVVILAIGLVIWLFGTRSSRS